MANNRSNNAGVLIFNYLSISDDSDLELRSSDQVQYRTGLSVFERIAGIQTGQLNSTSLGFNNPLQRLDSRLNLWTQEKISAAKQSELLSALFRRCQQQLMHCFFTPFGSKQTEQPKRPQVWGYGWVACTEQNNTHALGQQLARLEAAGVASDRILSDTELDTQVELAQFNQLMSLVQAGKVQIIVAICWDRLVPSSQFYQQFQNQINHCKVELRLLDQAIEQRQQGFISPALIEPRRSKDGKP